MYKCFIWPEDWLALGIADNPLVLNAPMDYSHVYEYSQEAG